MSVGQEIPLTGWDSTFKSIRITLNKGTYQAINTFPGTNELFGVRGRLPLSRSFSRWSWEIQVNGNTSVLNKSVYGVSKLFAPVNNIMFSLSTIVPGTVYQNDGTIFGTTKIFEPLLDGDTLTFILDYKHQFLAVARNGVFQGFMLDQTNFIINNDLYPYFATSVNGNGVMLRDGTPLSIAGSDKYNLFDPVNSTTPLNTEFAYNPYSISTQFQKEQNFRPYYYMTDPYLFFNNVQDAEFTALPNILSISPGSSPLVREDLIPIFWSNTNTASTITLSSNNLSVSSNVIATSSTNRAATFGTLYWEYEVIKGNNAISVGISNLDNSIHGQFVGYDNRSWGISSGAIHHNNISTPIIETIMNGDIINIAINIDNGNLWFGINGVYISGGDPTLGISPAFSGIIGNIYPAVSSRINTYWEIFGRFIRTSTGLPPIGFFNIDGTNGILNFGRPNVIWNKNTTTIGNLIFDKTIIANNNNNNTLSEGNLRIRFDGNTQSYAFGTRSHNIGKKYVEFQIIDSDNTSLSTFVGLSTLPNTNNNIVATPPTKNIIYFGTHSTINHMRSNFGTEFIEPDQFIIGDVVQMSIDFDNGKIWFGINGNWGNGNPSLGTNPNWQGTLNAEYYYIIMGDQSIIFNGELRINFGDNLYTFSKPNGFTSWNDLSSAAWDSGTLPNSSIISNNGLSVTGNTGLYSGLASYGRESGKHYFEVTVISTGMLLGKTAMIGVGNNSTIKNAFLGSNINSWAIWQLSGVTYNNNIVNNTGSINWLNVGDIIQIAVDLDLGSIWFGINGIWLDNSNPSINLKPRYNNLSGMIFPAYGNGSSGFGDMGELQINLIGAFTYAIPTTFSAWDTGIITQGGMFVDPDNLTAHGNGLVKASQFINTIDTEQFYMEFYINSISNITGIGLEITNPSSVVAHRFWRIKTSSIENKVDINEIEMFESSEGGIDVTNSIFAISDSEFNGGFLSQYAFNNTFTVPNVNTTGVRWSSDTLLGRERYIGQDFGIGNDKNIKRIAIKGGLESAVSWDLQYSDDGLTWFKIKTNIFVPFNVTVITNSSGPNNIERILYQSSGALGLLNKGITATLDPLKSSGTWQFFNNNIQVADIGFIGMSQATRSINSGKHYWEVRIEPPTDILASVVGFVPPGTDVNSFPGQFFGVGIHAATGNKWINGIETTFTTPLSVGDIVNFALDMNLGYAWIGINGTWISGDPVQAINPIVQNLSGVFFAAVGNYTNTLTETVAYTINLGQFLYINSKPNNFDNYGPAAGDGTFDTFSAGDLIGIAIDSITDQIWWSKNNVWIQGNAEINSGTMATLSGNVRIVFETLEGSITANFGETFFERNIFRSFKQFGCGPGGFANTPSIIWDIGLGILKEQKLRYIQSGAGSRTLNDSLGTTRKKYAEFTIHGTPINVFFGILNNLIYYNGSLCVGNTNFCGPHNQPILQTGDVIMIAINEITGKAWFGINGIWFNNGFPEVDSNETLLFMPGQNIVFGVIPTGFIDIRANLGTSSFVYSLPFTFEPYDISTSPGLTTNCVGNPVMPLLQSQGFKGHNLGLTTTTVNEKPIPDFALLNNTYEIGNIKLVNQSPLLNDLFPNQTINTTNTEQYFIQQFLHTISSSVIINDRNHAPFSGQIPFIDLIAGANIQEGVIHQLIFVPRSGNSIGSLLTPLKFNNININAIYDYASRLAGHNFSVIIKSTTQSNGKPNWPLPNSFNGVMSTTLSFNKLLLINVIPKEPISTSTTPRSSIPTFGNISIIDTIIFDNKYIQYAFILPINLMDNIKTGMALYKGSDGIRSVFKTPIFPEIISGRLHGG